MSKAYKDKRDTEKTRTPNKKERALMKAAKLKKKQQNKTLEKKQSRDIIEDELDDLV